MPSNSPPIVDWGHLIQVVARWLLWGILGGLLTLSFVSLGLVLLTPTLLASYYLARRSGWWPSICGAAFGAAWVAAYFDLAKPSGLLVGLGLAGLGYTAVGRLLKTRTHRGG